MTDFLPLNELLLTQINCGQLSHAYIFRGQQAMEQALSLAANLNCPNASHGMPCGGCSVCRNILAGTYPDCHIVEPDKGTHRIEGMKEMCIRDRAKTAHFGAPDSCDRHQRMLYYALRLATLMKMNSSEQHNLRILCYCHDIGLVGVHSSVLYKRGQLSADEQKIWDEHINYGADIMANIPQLARARCV